MAKAPRPGVVKTRLAQSLPSPAVIALYRCLLNGTMALARSLDGVQVAIMCPASDVEDLSRAAGDAMRVVAQIGNGLAAGLTSVFAHFAVSGRRRIVAFNSDSPHLPPSVLQIAFDALASCLRLYGLAAIMFAPLVRKRGATPVGRWTGMRGHGKPCP